MELYHDLSIDVLAPTLLWLRIVRLKVYSVVIQMRLLRIPNSAVSAHGRGCDPQAGTSTEPKA